MKKTILFLSFFIAVQLQAQINWELTWESDSLAIWPAGLAQINDSSYLTVSLVNNMNQNIPYPTSFVVIDKNGQVRDSLLSYPPLGQPSSIFKLENSKFLTLTTLTDALGQKKWVFCKFDAELNILWHKSYYLPENFYNSNNVIFCEEDSQANLTIVAYVSKNNNLNINDVLTMQLNEAGDSLSMKYLYNRNVNPLTSFIASNDSSYLMLCESFENPGEISRIVELDQNLEPREEYISDQVFGYTPEGLIPTKMKLYSEDSILTLRTYILIDKVELSYIDGQYDLINSTIITQNQNYSLLHQFQHLLISQDKNIYITYECGVLGRTIIKLDAGLNELWRLYLSVTDLSYFMAYDFIATMDDGLLMNFMGSNYPSQMKTHFLKIGPNGEVPTGFSNPEIQISNYKVYPNPGQNSLNIAVGRDFKSGQVQLFNLLGQKILEQKFNGFETQINTESLYTGVYTYRILEDDKLVHSGKWIKK